MRLLIDSNIFLEVIFSRANVAEAKQLLEATEDYDFFASDYSVHSIGTLLFKLNKKTEYTKLLEDLERNEVESLSLGKEDVEVLIKTSNQFKLDFDDAYQYTLATKHDLVLVSFDKDFDRTTRGRKTPQEILDELNPTLEEQ